MTRRADVVTTVNPASGCQLRSYGVTSVEEVERTLQESERAFRTWRDTDLRVRCATLHRVSALLRERTADLAALMSEEMGKPISQSRAEVDKCARVCDYYADHAADFLAAERVETEAAKSYVSYQPLGPILAIMPWNFPLWQVFRHAAPGLAAGNTLLLKHASNVTGCALAIEKLWRDAGAPAGAVQALIVPSDEMDWIIGHELVRGVTLTGSVEAGREVAATAAGALKKTVLELGGSDPYVIFSDADLVAAVESCAKSRLINSGQSCIAAKRFIVVESVRKRFEAMLTEQLRTARFGPPEDESTEVGPLARDDLRQQLHQQVTATIAAGARLTLGGELLDREGFWYPPTVLTGVEPGMAAFDEETFGPVAAIVSARDESHAVALANQSRFGLGAAVFTRDRDRGERVAERMLEAGSCFVNAFVRSDPRLPFGGIKDSGYGRELGLVGIREFVNIKSVWLG